MATINQLIRQGRTQIKAESIHAGLEGLSSETGRLYPGLYLNAQEA